MTKMLTELTNGELKQITIRLYAKGRVDSVDHLYKNSDCRMIYECNLWVYFW